MRPSSSQIPDGRTILMGFTYDGPNISFVHSAPKDWQRPQSPEIDGRCLCPRLECRRWWRFKSSVDFKILLVIRVLDLMWDHK